MSLGEIQQIYELLTKINDSLGDVDAKVTTLDRETPAIAQQSLTLQQAIRIAFRFNSTLSHMGLPPNVQQSISILQRMVFMMEMAYHSARLLQMGTPYGLIVGVLGGISVALSATDLEANR